MAYDLESQLLCLEDQHQQTPRPLRRVPIVEPASSSPRQLRSEHLDGLRGLAALFVFFSHITPDFTRGVHEHGFGESGLYWHFTSLPFIRLIWNGGNPAVSIFFVLSGYALSIAPLQKLSQSTGDGTRGEVRRSLLGAIVRRPIRLYAPALAIAAIQAVLLQVPGLVVIDSELPPQPQENLLEEMDYLIWNLGYLNPFRDHEVGEMFPYNKVIWTLPIELNGSILVYSILFVLSTGAIAGPGVRVPATIFVAMLLGGALTLQKSCNWSMVCFIWGMALAMIDVWPIGEYLRNRSQSLFPRRIAMKLVKILPSIVAEPAQSFPRLSKSSGSSTHLCFFTGWYLLCQPGYPGHREYSANTPGWIWLTTKIPSAYDDARFHRYWETIGSLLVVYAVLRIRWLQTFFQTRVLKFLGRVSFSLYLVHLPWTHIFADRVKSIIGGPVNPQLVGGFWDHKIEIQDAGPPGLSLMFIVGIGVILPSTLLVAWLGMVAFDLPSVRLGKWFTRRIRVDRRARASVIDLNTA